MKHLGRGFLPNESEPELSAYIGWSGISLIWSHGWTRKISSGSNRVWPNAVPCTAGSYHVHDFEVNYRHANWFLSSHPYSPCKRRGRGDRVPIICFDWLHSSYWQALSMMSFRMFLGTALLWMAYQTIYCFCFPDKSMHSMTYPAKPAGYVNNGDNPNHKWSVQLNTLVSLSPEYKTINERQANQV